VKLYGYFRSSAAYRVRIALALKKLAYDSAPLDLRGGAQRDASYRALNPQGLVPALDTGERVIAQSLAILEYLEETHPEPPLLPSSASARARVRQLAALVACDIHPLNNLRVLEYLERELGAAQPARERWIRHWIETGFAALESLVAGAPETGRFCHGDEPTLADVCLVPQLYNARRFGCELGPFPTLVAIDARCRELPAFAAAAPERQPDAG
jgi:maleylacetoacetate isomerase